MTQDEQGIIKCNHCDNKWSGQRGSTSNIGHHIKKLHYKRMSEQDVASLTTLGQTSGKKGDREVPQRCLLKRMIENAPALPRGSPSVKDSDRLLARYIVNSSTSMHLLEDLDFSNFVKSLKSLYTLPSRRYMSDNVVIPMYHATLDVIKEILSNCKNIGLTADAWSSINHTSYITVIAHTIDEECKLHHFVLDTGEIKVRHTSENLIIHISNVLKKFDLKARNQELCTTV